MDVPNLTAVKEMADTIDSEFDLKSRFDRYVSMSQDLLTLAKSNGIKSDDDAVRALFIADFVITSSEVPSGISDDERRISIFKTFISSMEICGSSAENTMRGLFLVQKVAISLKRNLSFLCGRGLPQDTALIFMKDITLSAYLKIVAEDYGWTSLSFALGALSAGVQNKLPDTEIAAFLEESKNVKNSDDLHVVQSWEVLTNLRDANPVTVNDKIVIPNIQESSVLFTAKFDKKPIISAWNAPNFLEKSNDQILIDYLDYFEKSDSSLPLMYFRGKTVEGDRSIIIVRDPYAPGKPGVLYKTTADEVNVTEVISILDQRSDEKEGWVQLFEQTPVRYQEKIEKEVEEVVTEEVEEPASEAAKPKGFFGKLKALFGGGSGSSSKPKKKVKTSTKKVKKTETVSKLKNRDIFIVPPILSQSIAASTIGGLQLFEFFDVQREDEYVIVGAMESNFEENKTTFVTESRFENPNQMIQLIDGLDQAMESTLNGYFGGSHQVYPSEIMFRSKDGSRFIIMFEANEKRIVGTIAITYKKDMSAWQDKEEQTQKRRTLQMRTGQLMSARVHTPFDTSIERIYGDTINKSKEIFELDHAVLSIDN